MPGRAHQRLRADDKTGRCQRKAAKCSGNAAPALPPEFVSLEWAKWDPLFPQLSLEIMHGHVPGSRCVRVSAVEGYSADVGLANPKP